MKNDKELQSDITAELLWDSAVDATGLGVSVNDGVATITGQVNTFAQNDAVARAVHRVAGVRGLVIRLEVKLAPDHKRSDEELSEAARYALRWNSLVPDDKVKVEVEDGWVAHGGTGLRLPARQRRAMHPPAGGHLCPRQQGHAQGAR